MSVSCNPSLQCCIPTTDQQLTKKTESCEHHIELVKDYYTSQMAPEASTARREEIEIKKGLEANPPSIECKNQIKDLIKNNKVQIKMTHYEVGGSLLTYNRFGKIGWCEEELRNKRRYGGGTFAIYSGTACFSIHDNLETVKTLLETRDETFEEKISNFLKTNELEVDSEFSYYFTYAAEGFIFDFPFNLLYDAYKAVF